MLIGTSSWRVTLDGMSGSTSQADRRGRGSRTGSDGQRPRSLGDAWRPETILAICLAVDGGLGFAHLVNLGGIPLLERPTAFFDLRSEQNLPTWWASAKLLIAGATLGLLLPRFRRWSGPFVGVFLGALLLTFLSLDEAALIHEYIGRRTRFEGLPVTGLWSVAFGFGALVAAAVLAVIGRSLWRLDVRASASLAGGLLLLVVSAAGLDLIVNVAPDDSPVVIALSFVEEMGELVAVSVIMYGAWRLARPMASRANLGPMD